MDWRDSVPRALLHHLADDVLGPAGLNGAIDLLLNATGLGGDGTLDVELGLNASVDLPALATRVTVGLDRLTLDGLDTLTSVRLLDVPAEGAPGSRDPAALINAVSMGRLGAAIGLSLTVAPLPPSPPALLLSPPPPLLLLPSPPPTPPARLSLHIEATNMSLGVDGTLAVNRTELLDTTLGALATPGGAAACLLGGLAGVSARQLNWSVASLELGASGNDWGYMRRGGGGGGGGGEAHAELTPPFGALSLPPSAAATVSIAAQVVLYLLKSTLACPPPPPPSPPDYFDLSSSAALRGLADRLHNLSDAALAADVRNLTASINRLYNKLFNGTATWPAGYLPLPNLPFAFHDEKVGDVTVELANASLAHLDSLFGLDMAVRHATPRLLTVGLGVGDGAPKPLTLGGGSTS